MGRIIVLVVNLIIGCLLAFNSKGQFYQKDVSAVIRDLRAAKVDTIIELTTPEYQFMPSFLSVKNLGEVSPSKLVYLFYPKNGGLTVKQLLWYYDTSAVGSP